MGPGALISIALAIGCGLLLAVQGPINARLGESLGHPVGAALVSLTVSAACGLALYLGSGQAAEWRAPALWLYLAGGCLGIAAVVGGILLVPRLGAGTFLACAIFGQMAAGLVLDHFGFFGLAQTTFSMTRLAAAGLVLAGALLMRFG